MTDDQRDERAVQMADVEIECPYCCVRFAHYQPDADRVEALVEAAERAHTALCHPGGEQAEWQAVVQNEAAIALRTALANLRPEAKP